MKILMSEEADVDGFATVLDRMKGLNVAIITKDGKTFEGEITAHTSDGDTSYLVLHQSHEVKVEQIETVTYL